MPAEANMACGTIGAVRLGEMRPSARCAWSVGWFSCVRPAWVRPGESSSKVWNSLRQRARNTATMCEGSPSSPVSGAMQRVFMKGTRSCR